jgi:hypothetical protein
MRRRKSPRNDCCRILCRLTSSIPSDYRFRCFMDEALLAIRQRRHCAYPALPRRWGGLGEVNSARRTHVLARTVNPDTIDFAGYVMLWDSGAQRATGPVLSRALGGRPRTTLAMMAMNASTSSPEVCSWSGQHVRSVFDAHSPNSDFRGFPLTFLSLGHEGILLPGESCVRQPEGPWRRTGVH